MPSPKRAYNLLRMCEKNQNCKTTIKINTLDEYSSLVFLQYNTTMYRNEYI